jgi:hypothetical protein
LSINKRRLAANERYLPIADVLLRDEYLVVGKGRREYALVRIVGA